MRSNHRLTLFLPPLPSAAFRDKLRHSDASQVLRMLDMLGV
ncbi:hypothetical protein [Hymenobacter sp. 102]